MRAASANLNLGDDPAALEWARRATAESEEATVRRVYGVVLSHRGELEAAENELRAAWERASQRGDTAEQAQSARALAGLLWRSERFREATTALELSASAAARAGDAAARGQVELARGDLQSKLGDADRALHHFRLAAEALRPWPWDRAYAQLKIGILHSEHGELGLAEAVLEDALALAKAQQNQTVTQAARLNLLYVCAALGATSAAKVHLAELPEGARQSIGARYSRALLALQAERPAEALEQVDAALAGGASGDWIWDLQHVRGQALERLSRTDDAARAYRAAMAAVRRVGAGHPAQQGWIVSRRRAPFDAAFLLAARAGRAQEAFEVADEYAEAEALQWTSAEPQALASPRPEVRAGQELALLYEAGGRLWAVRAGQRTPTVVDVGAMVRVSEWIQRLIARPGDRAAAESLGELLWAPLGLRASTRPLYLVPTGRLRRLPFAALMTDGRIWPELRPLVQLASSRPNTRAPPHGWMDRALLLGDPAGELPAARRELQWLGARLKSSPKLGAEATRTELSKGRGGRLLHLAAHGDWSGRESGLRLADGLLAPAEVLEGRYAAGLVVLAACASGVGRDEANSDSLATAFFGAGSGTVVATLRSVPDADAERLLHVFYEEGGLVDPPRALARAQVVSQHKMAPESWASFFVLAEIPPEVHPERRAP